MNNRKQFDKESDTPLRQMGAEELAGSGFEKEIPDSGFTASEIAGEHAGRK